MSSGADDYKAGRRSAGNADKKDASDASRLTACEREGFDAGTAITTMIRYLTGTGLQPIVVTPPTAQPARQVCAARPTFYTE